MKKLMVIFMFALFVAQSEAGIVKFGFKHVVKPSAKVSVKAIKIAKKVLI